MKKPKNKREFLAIAAAVLSLVKRFKPELVFLLMVCGWHGWGTR